MDAHLPRKDYKAITKCLQIPVATIESAIKKCMMFTDVKIQQRTSSLKAGLSNGHYAKAQEPMPTGVPCEQFKFFQIAVISAVGGNH